MHKQFEAEIQNFGTGVCGVQYADENKKTELSNFKTRRSKTSQSFCMQGEHAKQYTPRYNITNIIM